MPLVSSSAVKQRRRVQRGRTPPAGRRGRRRPWRRPRPSCPPRPGRGDRRRRTRPQRGRAAEGASGTGTVSRCPTRQEGAAAVPARQGDDHRVPPRAVGVAAHLHRQAGETRLDAVADGGLVLPVRAVWTSSLKGFSVPAFPWAKAPLGWRAAPAEGRGRRARGFLRERGAGALARPFCGSGRQGRAFGAFGGGGLAALRESGGVGESGAPARPRFGLGAGVGSGEERCWPSSRWQGVHPFPPRPAPRQKNAPVWL